MGRKEMFHSINMGNSHIFQLCSFIFLACSALAISADQSNISEGHSNNRKPRVSLFVFGDSLYDPGNNNYITTTTPSRATFLPYGETFFEFATGRFSNGRLIPDFIAKLAKLPLIPPYFQSSSHRFSYGVNFASAGAGALVETHQENAVIHLHQQLMYFRDDVVKQLRTRLGNKETEELLSNAVYMFDIGVNDISSRSPIFRNFSSEEYVEIIVGNFSSVLREVYKAGGRKFGLVNVLSLRCIPSVRARYGDDEESMENLTRVVMQYNAAVSKELKKLEKQLEGFIYSKFDFFTAVNDRIQNPSKYGFKEVKSACCGSGVYRGNNTCASKTGDSEYELCENPEEYFFFDSNHPSEKVYKQFAELMWDGPPNLTAPYTLKSLFHLRTLANGSIHHGRHMF